MHVYQRRKEFKEFAQVYTVKREMMGLDPGLSTSQSPCIF